MQPFFSVIIPLYNKAPYIKRALDSVLVQSYTNFEIVVVDDGSSDGGEVIVSNINDNKIRLISQKNSGVSAARNKGASKSKNEYLAFLDGDDTWEPNFLIELVNLITNFPNAGIYGTSNSFIYPNGKKVAEDFSYLFTSKDQGLLEDYFGLFAQIHKSPFSNSNICIPKKIYNEFGGYKLGVKLTEDSDLWCRIALKYDIAFSIKPLANYFVALEGSTHTSFEPKEFEVSIMLKQKLKNKEIPEKYILSVKKLIIFQKLSLLKRAILTNNNSFAIKLIGDYELFRYFPVAYTKCIIALIFPSWVFNSIRKYI